MHQLNKAIDSNTVSRKPAADRKQADVKRPAQIKLTEGEKRRARALFLGRPPRSKLVPVAAVHHAVSANDNDPELTELVAMCTNGWDSCNADTPHPDLDHFIAMCTDTSGEYDYELAREVVLLCTTGTSPA
jgi:hypothetical protein